VNHVAQKHFLREPLVGLVLATLLALPASLNGQETIVYGRLYTAPPHTLQWDEQGYRLFPGLSGHSTFSLDMNQDGISDFTFTAGDSFDIVPQGINAVSALHPTPTELSSFVSALSGGLQIGPNPQGFQWIPRTDTPFGSVGSGLSACRDIGCIGNYAGIESAYAGVQFQIASETHYGWIRIGAPLPAFNGGWIYDYAFDSRPDTAIAAGAGAVPEPTILALLFVSLVLLLARRSWTSKRS
jgi:hypothetical protein